MSVTFERHGYATWPGVQGVISCRYTMSQGISAGCATLRILPQDPKSIARTGTLTITDTFGKVEFPDCIVVDDQIGGDPQTGFISTLRIWDRRWKWRGLGQISGAYNQLDKRGKLLPETIRSPEELAILCLQAMGETKVTIHLPKGLTRKDGQDWQGLNPSWYNTTPTTGTNPPVNWEAGTITPAAALQQICDLYSCRICLRASDNGVFIGPIGIGQDLPDGAIRRETMSLKNPATPTGVAAAGSPTLYQMRLLMRAVAPEWHGGIVPIERLMYRPQPDAKPQISRIIIRNPVAGERYQLFLNGPMDQDPTAGFLAEYISTGADTATIYTELADKINNSQDPQIVGVATAVAGIGSLTITSAQPGISFRVFARIGNGSSGGSIVWELRQPANSGRPGDAWAFSFPGTQQGFQGVREIPGRLTRLQAVELAKKYVFKMYQLVNVDVSGRGPIQVPGYTGVVGTGKNARDVGQIRYRRQIVLTDSQCRSIRPEAPDPKLFDPKERLGDNVQQAVRYFYDGYAKSKPAEAFGSIAKGITQKFWRADMGIGNTLPADQIFIDFDVDPDEQTIVFHEYVYQRVNEQSVGPARVVLETGVHVRNAETNALECYAYPILLPNMAGTTNFKISKHPDVRREFVGIYDDKDVLTKFDDHTNFAENADIRDVVNNNIVVDAVVRAKYYATAMMIPYQIDTAETREYAGIVVADLDGTIAQISWNVDGSMASTTISRNVEHDLNVPPYPQRVRDEFLDPVARVAIQQAVAPPRLGDSLNHPGG